ncbi:MAG: hypothetical protein J0L62_03370 [Bacteroidetes bacterium]|nr:hypothetical protein [Bacteroidota bacterium]
MARFFLVPYLHFSGGTRFPEFNRNWVKVTKSEFIIIRTEAETGIVFGYSRDDF